MDEKQLSARRIKDLLQNMRLELCAHGFDSDYHTSNRGVPYVHVMVKGYRYQFVYFARTRIFRIFNSSQAHVDFVGVDEVIRYFKLMRGDE